MNRLIVICLAMFLSSLANSQARDSIKARFFQDSAWKAYKENYFKKSIRLLDSAILYDNTKGDFYHLKAEALWFVDEYAEAAKNYQNLISLDGDYLLKVGARVFLGMLYDKAGMPTQAKNEYVSAVTLWESGYKPLNQFREYEQSDYLLALTFLGEKEKVRKAVNDAKEYRFKEVLEWLKIPPRELLEIHFKEFMLPDHIKPLEE